MAVPASGADRSLRLWVLGEGQLSYLLRACYAMSGIYSAALLIGETSATPSSCPGAICPCACYEKSGTDIANGVIRFAVSGTDFERSCLRACYETSGTDVACGTARGSQAVALAHVPVATFTYSIAGK
eukprot:103007-Rhodomonas_salina.1